MMIFEEEAERQNHINDIIRSLSEYSYEEQSMQECENAFLHMQ